MVGFGRQRGGIIRAPILERENNMRTVEEIYLAHKASLVATAKHLGYLRDLASRCKIIWEIGVKRGASSSAFLAGLPEGGILRSVDLKIAKQANELRRAAGPRWDLHEGDSLTTQFPNEDPDLIFFDSLHVFSQLAGELKRFGDASKGRLVFHDTITFATKGADGESGTYLPQPEDRSCFDAESHGIRLAIDEFMAANSHWRIERHAPYGHGLLTLVRG